MDPNQFKQLPREAQLGVLMYLVEAKGKDINDYLVGQNEKINIGKHEVLEVARSAKLDANKIVRDLDVAQEGRILADRDDFSAEAYANVVNFLNENRHNPELNARYAGLLGNVAREVGSPIKDDEFIGTPDQLFERDGIDGKVILSDAPADLLISEVGNAAEQKRAVVQQFMEVLARATLDPKHFDEVAETRDGTDVYDISRENIATLILLPTLGGVAKESKAEAIVRAKLEDAGYTISGDTKMGIEVEQNGDINVMVYPNRGGKPVAIDARELLDPVLSETKFGSLNGLLSQTQNATANFGLVTIAALDAAERARDAQAGLTAEALKAAETLIDAEVAIPGGGTVGTGDGGASPSSSPSKGAGQDQGTGTGTGTGGGLSASRD